MITSSPELPALDLNGNVIEYLRGVKAVDLEKAVANGLKPEILFRKKVDGQYITAHCSPDGQVYLSPTFAQALWCMAYLIVKISDDGIVRGEFKEYGVDLMSAYREIKEQDVKYRETEYIRSLVEARELSALFQLVCRFTKHSYSDADIEVVRVIQSDGELVRRVNGVYMAAVGFLLIHEAAHFDSTNIDFPSKEEKEQYADDRAMEDTFYRGEQWRKTSQLGALCALLMGFISNPPLAPVEGYYREDVRLFRQAAKVTDQRMANVVVAYVLCFWLDTYHDITIKVRHNSENETITEIKNTIKEKFN